VEITFEGGNTYTPGAVKRVTVRLTEVGARNGFQSTARSGDGFAEPAGTLAAGAGMELNGQYIQHSQASTSGSWTFDWTAPSDPVGPVRFYASANAANGNGVNDEGDRIFTTSAELSPPGAGGQPTINDNGVVNGASFQGGFAPGSWISIFGTNMASTTRDWSGLISNDGVFPTAIEGTSVMVNNKPAAIWVISPTQLNVQVPDDTATGPVQVVVTTAAGTTTSTGEMRQLAPAFFMFDPDSRKYIAAQHPNSNGRAVGRAGLFGSARESAPAEPGAFVELYATGFGATNPARPSGRLVTEVAPTSEPVTVTVGGVNATVDFAGLVGAGLYQINIVVPDLPNGDHEVVATIGGQSTQTGAFITVQRP
jgi:uncharacterized protein (TIGR03437 family)